MSETNRWFYPFKPVGPYPLAPPVADYNEDRASAEVGLDTRQRSETRRIQKFSGRALSKSAKIRLDKGFQDLGLGVFLGTFCTSKKYPGVRGRVAPEKPRLGAGEALDRPRRRARRQKEGDRLQFVYTSVMIWIKTFSTIQLAKG